jgi:hypothetical protein
MAVVYLARDPSMKRQVAVKLLPHEFTFDPQFRSRFQQEAEVIAALEHPYIVPVYDYGETEGQPFIVMRYLPGGTLTDRLRQGSLALAEVSVLLHRIGAALDHAHSQGVVHRDVKPANILYDASGGVFLSDFGIAKLVESSAAFTGTAVLGTPEYISPEQARGEKYLDGRSDVYSLGVVLFHALTGELPFEADTPMGLAVAHLSTPPPSVLAKKQDLPSAVAPVVLRSMEKDPARRFPTGSALAQSFQGALAQGEAVPVAEPPGSTVIEPYPAAVPVVGMEAPDRGPGGSMFSGPPPAVVKKQGLPRWAWIVGALAVVAVLCVAGAGLAFSVLPGLLGSNATPTGETAALPNTGSQSLATATPPLPTQPAAVPVGLTTTYIEYILDASGSMLETLEGKTRLAIAQDVLTSRLKALPPGAQIGLRVYGHRVPYQNNEAESCKDIELVVPIQANGAQPIIDWLPTMQALGMTPMSESIRLAAEDFTFEPGRKNFIVLISDGEETCGDDPATVVQYLKEIGIDFTIHVIGLDVDAQTREQLSRIAEAAGGRYHDANSEADLQAALDQVNSDMYAEPAPGVVSQAQDTSTPPSPAATETPIPEPNAEISQEGTALASSIYNAELNTSMALDDDPSTSWFSAGPGKDGNIAYQWTGFEFGAIQNPSLAGKSDVTVYQWTGQQDDFIAAIDILSNEQNQVVEWRQGYGFESVIVQVLDAQGSVVFEESADLSGTPDPNVTVAIQVVGRSVLLIFSGSEALDCGGFAELKIHVVR